MRYLTVVGRFDLLISVSGGKPLIPRQVLDPDDDPISPMQSEIGEFQKYLLTRSADTEAKDDWSRVEEVRHRGEFSTVDLIDNELSVFADLRSRKVAFSQGLATPFGPGEAAVMTLSLTRRWDACIDEMAARNYLEEASPETRIWTLVDLLLLARELGICSGSEVEQVYADVLAKGYWGPTALLGTLFA